MLLRHLRRQLHRGNGLEQREERAAEEAGLLPGDDDACGGIGKRGAGLARRSRRAAAFLLRGDDARDFGGLPRQGTRARDRVGPRGRRCRIAGVKRRDVRERERIVRRQTPNPRKCSDVDRQS